MAVEYGMITLDNYLEKRTRCYAEIDSKRSIEERLVTVASMSAKFTKAYARETEERMKVRVWDVSGRHLEGIIDNLAEFQMGKVWELLQNWDNSNHEENLLKWKMLNTLTGKVLAAENLTKSNIFGIEEDFECYIDITTPDSTPYLVADMLALEKDFRRHYNAVAGRNPDSSNSGGYGSDYIKDFGDALEAMLEWGVHMPANFTQTSQNNKKPRWLNCLSGLGDDEHSNRVRRLHETIMSGEGKGTAANEYRRIFERDGNKESKQASQFFSNQHGRNPLILLPTFLFYVCELEVDEIGEALALMSSVMMSHPAKQKDIVAGLSKCENELGKIIARHLVTNDLDIYASPLHYSATRLRVDLACFTRSPSWYVLSVLPAEDKMLFNCFMHSLERRAGLPEPRKPQFSYTMNARTTARNYESPLKCTTFMRTNRYVSSWVIKGGREFHVGIGKGKANIMPPPRISGWAAPGYSLQQGVYPGQRAPRYMPDRAHAQPYEGYPFMQGMPSEAYDGRYDRQSRGGRGREGGRERVHERDEEWEKMEQFDRDERVAQFGRRVQIGPGEVSEDAQAYEQVYMKVRSEEGFSHDIPEPSIPGLEDPEVLKTQAMGYTSRYRKV